MLKHDQNLSEWVGAIEDASTPIEIAESIGGNARSYRKPQFQSGNTGVKTPKSELKFLGSEILKLDNGGK
ncbi:unnamed protein product [Linum trigynum]|uniref:Uncharacterized protein n=1 Tax=Linum trigynum TaxID=586398 RepID=A0AAV2EAR1_9ROSI